MEHPETRTSSKSARSSTSTGDKDTEPLATLRPKIVELCYSVGLGLPIALEEMESGTYNRVLSLNFDTSDNNACVIRIPHYAMEDEVDTMKDQVALLNFLALRLPVARVISYDAGIANPISSQYTIQTRIPGLPISKVYRDLSFEERLQIVDGVVTTISQINSVRFSTAGRLTARSSYPESSCNTSAIENSVELKPFRLGLIESSTEVPASTAIFLKDLIFSMIDAWAIEDAEAPALSGLQAKWKNLKNIAEEMLAMGMLDSANDDNVLWHWDFFARNILVEKQDNVWSIRGVIDWDSAISVPRVLSRCPPAWLWRYHDDPSGWDGDYDDLPPRDLTDEESSIKRRFDEGMAHVHYGSGTHLSHAYGDGVWVRRLVRFALKGFGDSQDWKRYDVFVEEWGKVFRERPSSRSGP